MEEGTKRAGQPVLRVTAGKTMAEAPAFFLGDKNGTGRWAATEWGAGTVLLNGPGSTLGHQVFLPPSMLRAGSIYVTTPSINFVWGK